MLTPINMKKLERIEEVKLKLRIWRGKIEIILKILPNVHENVSPINHNIWNLCSYPNELHEVCTIRNI